MSKSILIMSGLSLLCLTFPVGSVTGQSSDVVGKANVIRNQDQANDVDREKVARDVAKVKNLLAEVHEESLGSLHQGRSDEALHAYYSAITDQKLMLQREMEHLIANVKLMTAQLERLEKLENQLKRDPSASREKLFHSAEVFGKAAKVYVAELDDKLTEKQKMAPQYNELVARLVDKNAAAKDAGGIASLKQELAFREQKAAQAKKEALKEQANANRIHLQAMELAKVKALEAERKVLEAENVKLNTVLRWEKGVKGLVEKAVEQERAKVQEVEVEASELRLKKLEKRLERMEQLLEKIAERK